ncbi:MAG: hypothetical protein ACRC0R_02475 [Cetobacterium sp.]
MSTGIEKAFINSDEHDKFVAKYYRESSVQHIANMIGIDQYRVQSIIARLVLNGKLIRKKKHETKWGKFLEENYLKMTRAEIVESTGLCRSSVDRFIKKIKLEADEK